MAQTITGFYGQVPAALEAARFHRLRPPVVSKSTDFALASSASGRVINIAAGTMLACGILHTETAATSITLPANSAGATRWDIIGIRYTWATNTAVLFSKRGTTTTNLPVLERNPGVVYEVPLMAVQVTNGVTTVPSGNIYSTVLAGGFGRSPFRANSMTASAIFDLPVGARVRQGSGEYEVLTNDGTNTTLTAVTVDPGPWPTFTPTLRAGSGFTPVNWGFGGVVRGFYHLENGSCHCKIELRRGTSGDNLGSGFYSLDLPVLPAAAPVDQWGEGVLWTNVGGSMNWPIKCLIRRDLGARARLYAPVAGNDARFMPQGSIQSGGPGNGIPYIAGTNSIPQAIIFDFAYLI